MFDHGVHCGPPLHPELPGQLRHGTGVGTHLPAHLPPRPLGEHRTGRGVLGDLRPRPGGALSEAATPTAFPPLQPHRTSETREITEGTLDSVLSLGPPATPLTDHDVAGGLDPHDQLTVALGDFEHPEPVKTEQRLRQADTVVCHQGSPIPRGRWTAHRMARPLTSPVDSHPTPDTPTPHFTA